MTRPVPVASVQGTLALQYDHQVRSVPSPDLRLVAGGRAELEAFAHRFARAVVEVVGGDRGPSQLLRWTSPSVYDELQRRASA
ncbi:MAG: Rv3235 family protein, partial [Marmoricola sp.]